MSKPRVVDLFAGCGGLSLGLEAAGIDPILAIEKSPMAAETHFRNFHLRSKEWNQDLWEAVRDAGDHVEKAKSGTMVADVTEVAEDDRFLRWLSDLEPEVMAGGPPCQGFSMAGRRNPSDARNRLPWDFLTLVEHGHPRVVLIENVLGMNRAFRKDGEFEPPLEALRRALEQTGDGYVVQVLQVNARHFGVPQNRPRVMLFGVRRDVARQNSIAVRPDIWRSSEPARDSANEGFDLAPDVQTPSPSDQSTAWEAIGDLSDTGYRFGAGDRRYAAFPFARMMRTDDRSSTGDVLQNQVVRMHTERTTARFALYQTLRDRAVPKTVMGIGSVASSSTEARVLLEEALNGQVELPKGLLRYFPEGDLADAVLEMATKKHSQRAIAKDAPAPTVVTLPDDYIHPTRPRIMTVRELARFQSFPDWFEFRSKETTGSDRRRFEVPQYSQVGNAVPPLLARAVGLRAVEIARP